MSLPMVDERRGAACIRCQYWVERELKDENDWLRGECRKDAPRIADNNRARWPITLAGEWCGEFVLDPDVKH